MPLFKISNDGSIRLENVVTQYVGVSVRKKIPKFVLFRQGYVLNK